MKSLVLISLLASSLLLVACGESSQDKAKKKVCSARADIGKQVNQLKNLTPATATTSGIKDSLTSIQNDLKTIADAQPKLNEQRKKQVQAANEKFVSEFQSIVSSVGSNLSLSNAQQQLQQAAQQLASAYQASFAKVDCG